MAQQVKGNITKLKCPFCNNDCVLVMVDFVKKRTNDKKNVALCVQRERKSVFGETKVTGCGKTFNLDFVEKEIFPRYFSV